MNGKTKMRLSMIMNLMIFLITTGVVISYFFGNDGAYHIQPLFRFNLFTTDSNILCAIAAAIMIPFEIRQLKNGTPIPRAVFILKYLGTCAVVLTFFVVVLFLGPSTNFIEMVFGGTSIYMHFFGPILAFVSFCFLETAKPVSLRLSLIGLVPMLIYGTVYCIEVVFITEENGGWMDFYGFNQSGYWYLSFLMMILGMLMICMMLRAVHNAISRKQEKK